MKEISLVEDKMGMFTFTKSTIALLLLLNVLKIRMQPWRKKKFMKIFKS